MEEIKNFCVEPTLEKFNQFNNKEKLFFGLASKIGLKKYNPEKNNILENTNFCTHGFIAKDSKFDNDRQGI